MKFIRLSLPKSLWSVKGYQRKISFSLGKKDYKINNETTPLTYILKGVRGYSHHIMNTVVFVTLFYDEDIIS